MSKAVKDQAWKDAKKKYRLSDTTLQIARDLGLNLHKLGKIANHKQEPWKESLSDFIQTLHKKRFKSGGLS